jgi:hypothetical protein
MKDEEVKEAEDELRVSQTHEQGKEERRHRGEAYRIVRRWLSIFWKRAHAIRISD